MRVFGNGDIGVPVQEGVHEIPETVSRALLVIVDEDDIVAVGKVTAAGQRVVTSAVLGEVNGEDLRIIFRLSSDNVEQIVRRTVIDGNDLISKIRPFRDDLTNFIYDESYGPFAVVTRNDETDQFLTAFMDHINIH
jgi:hypothetical protein